MKRTKILAALTCALLVFVLAGCGTSNKLQSITLGASSINGVPVQTQAGFFSLEGLGGTIQLQAIGNYSSGKTHDLSNVVTYTMILDPSANEAIDGSGNFYLLPSPPQTAQISVTGLVTSTEPAACTWLNSNPGGAKPAWAYVGDYTVTATFQGVTSQPIYIPVASAAGIVSVSNPTGACGPTS